MRLMIKRALSFLPGFSDTIATSAGTASAGLVPHLGSTGQLSGTFTNVFTNAGAPVDGGSGTGATIAGKGSLLIDTTNANLYINGNTLASPTWKLVTRAA